MILVKFAERNKNTNASSIVSTVTFIPDSDLSICIQEQAEI